MINKSLNKVLYNFIINNTVDLFNSNIFKKFIEIPDYKI